MKIVKNTLIIMTLIFCSWSVVLICKSWNCGTLDLSKLGINKEECQIISSTGSMGDPHVDFIILKVQGESKNIMLSWPFYNNDSDVAIESSKFYLEPLVELKQLRTQKNTWYEDKYEGFYDERRDIGYILFESSDFAGHRGTIMASAFLGSILFIFTWLPYFIVRFYKRRNPS